MKQQKVEIIDTSNKIITIFDTPKKVNFHFQVVLLTKELYIDVL